MRVAGDDDPSLSGQGAGQNSVVVRVVSDDTGDFSGTDNLSKSCVA